MGSVVLVSEDLGLVVAAIELLASSLTARSSTCANMRVSCLPPCWIGGAEGAGGDDLYSPIAAPSSPGLTQTKVALAGMNVWAGPVVMLVIVIGRGHISGGYLSVVRTLHSCSYSCTSSRSLPAVSFHLSILLLGSVGLDRALGWGV
jgi:hypothetical protein